MATVPSAGCRLLHPSIVGAHQDYGTPLPHHSFGISPEGLSVALQQSASLKASLTSPNPRATPAATPHAGVARYSDGHHILQAFQMPTVPVR